MAVQTVTTTSYGSRIMGSFKGIITGIILFIVSIPVLWMNEGRAVKTYKALKEGAGAVISVEANQIDGGNEGKLIHISGKAETADILTDPQFGVSFTGIGLEREVEMYQWRENSSTETKKKVGGSEEKITTYTYEKAWSSSAINSSTFQERVDPQTQEQRINPGAIPYEETKQKAKNVNVGAFKLTDDQISRIGTPISYSLKEDQPLPNIPNIARMANGFYISKNGTSSLAAPVVGDIKVTFKIIAQQDISICSVQTGESFKPYKAKNGKSIDLLSSGIKTADEMFESAQKGNVFLTWLIRIIGFILMYAGISTILAPFAVMADVLPFLGSLVRTGTSAISFLISLPISLLIIALAWIFYRPLLGITLLVIVVVCAVLIIKKVLAAKAAAPAETPAQG